MKCLPVLLPRAHDEIADRPGGDLRVDSLGSSCRGLGPMLLLLPAHAVLREGKPGAGRALWREESSRFDEVPRSRGEIHRVLTDKRAWNSFWET